MDYISPAKYFAEDIVRNSINKGFDKTLGIRPIKEKVVTELSNSQMEALRNQVKFAKNRGSKGFSSNMYQQMYGHRYSTNNRGFFDRIATPDRQVEHILGRYGFYVDENGDTIVHDIYDYNRGQGSNDTGLYGFLRNEVAKLSSSSDDPNENKIKFRINLGKV